MIATMSWPQALRVLLALGCVFSRPAVLASEEPGRPAAQGDAAALDARALVRELAARSAKWVSPPPDVGKLEYDFFLGSEVSRVRVQRGEQRPNSVWMGATLHAGFQSVVRFPDRYDVTLTQQSGAKTITLLAKLKNQTQFIAVEVGNGVENSWRGYYSHQARETSIVVDAERLVPIEEQTGASHIRYSDWQDIGQGRWVPGRIDVAGLSNHYRMTFDWLAGAIWLLHKSEALMPEETLIQSRTRNVLVDGRPVAGPVSNDDQRSNESKQILVTMLDHNAPWLDGGATGAGWQPPFQTLSYSFHTVREGIREAVVLDRGGEAVFEVVHDPQGKMKNQLGDRQITLNTRQYALSKQGSHFSWVHGCSSRERNEPFDLELKRCGRIGCRLDMPLFHYRELLDSAVVTIDKGTWNGRRCQVATVALPAGSARLSFGTMFAFTSWSYVHDIIPSKEALFLDVDRKVPLHETLTSIREKEPFDIDFSDYVEIEPGQWAPLSIRVEWKGYFTCQYTFQIVRGKHWMLKEVVSWFRPESKGRGVIEDVRVDGDRARLNDALRQVEATRRLFSGSNDDRQHQLRVAPVPFQLGVPMSLGPYSVRVALQSRGLVSVTASTTDRTAPATVPLGFLDGKGRLFFAPSVVLTAQGGIRRGATTVRGSYRWQEVKWVAGPANNSETRRQAVPVVPLRWGEPMAVNIPDSSKDGRSSRGEREVEKSPTRAFQLRADRNGDGSAKLTVDIVSIDGPHEFFLDLAGAILGRSGAVLASGHVSTDLRVEHRPVEQRLEIPLGQLGAGEAPAFVALGITPGNITSAPLGSRWGMILSSTGAFDVAMLLAAPDEESRRSGLEALVGFRTNRIISFECTGDEYDDPGTAPEPEARRKLLQPLAKSLAQIAREPGAGDVRATAVRFLAYSETKDAPGVLRPLAEDQDPRVREAASIGLTFLGHAGYLETLRAILNRARGREEDEPQWALDRWTDQDALIALMRQHSDTAVDILGATLINDLKGLELVQAGTPQVRLQGRGNRASEICGLLGRTGNPRSVRWLLAADVLIAGQPDLVNHFSRDALVRAILRFVDEAKDHISDELEIGAAASAWSHALARTIDPDFLPSIRAMLDRNDVPESARWGALHYLSNLGTPQALDVLREVYDRGLLKSSEYAWLDLCESLATKGDGRGLPDAFAVLVDLERPAEPPADDQKRRKWEGDRGFLKQRAEAVFERAPRDVLARFLAAKAQVTSPIEQGLVVRLLWRLDDVPAPVAAVLPGWARSDDVKLAEMARRLLERK